MDEKDNEGFFKAPCKILQLRFEVDFDVDYTLRGLLIPFTCSKAIFFNKMRSLENVPSLYEHIYLCVYVNLMCINYIKMHWYINMTIKKFMKVDINCWYPFIFVPN